MHNTVFHYEVGRGIKSPFWYVITVLLFVFSFLTMLGTGGYFDGGSADLALASPYFLTDISFFLTKILLLFAAAVAGQSLHRDYRYRMYHLLYTYPLTKQYFLNGKAGSVLLLTGLTTVAVWGGVVCAVELMNDGTFTLGNRVVTYAAVAGLYMLPSVFLTAGLVFILTGLTRNIYAGFGIVIGMFLLPLLLENIFVNQPQVSAVLDPLGQHVFQLHTRNRDLSASGTADLPFGAVLLCNRLLWSAVLFVLYRVFVKRFALEFAAPWNVHLGRRSSRKSRNSVPVKQRAITYRFGFKSRVRTFFFLTGYNVRHLLSRKSFWGINLLGAVTVFFILTKITNTGEFNLLPLTKTVIGVPLLIYSLVLTVATFFFSGRFVHRARSHNMHLLTDVTPVKSLQMLTAVAGAVAVIHLVQLLVFWVTGLTVQLLNGFNHIQSAVYLKHLFLVVFPVLTLWNITALFVHTLIPRFFPALFVSGGIWLSGQLTEEIGLESRLFRFNGVPFPEFSDFYGYGNALAEYKLLLPFWAAIAFILFVFTHLLWVRGNLTDVKTRLRRIKRRFSYVHAGVLLLLCTIAIVTGSKIIREEAAVIASEAYLKVDPTDGQSQRYAHIAPPQITDVRLNLDLFPQERRFEAHGDYVLVNGTGRIMDTVLVRTGFDEQTDLTWQTPVRLLEKNPILRTELYEILQPVLPGDTLRLAWQIESTPNTALQRNSNVLTDGTFLRQDFLPRFGSRFAERELPLTDTLARRYNFYHRDAAYTNLTARISTDRGQTVLAPGRLTGSDTVGTRVVSFFQTPHPIKFNFSFHAGAYRSERVRGTNADVIIYHHPDHTRNLPDLAAGAQSALPYMTERFGAYPYRELCIVEVPQTEADFSATLTADNLPASEMLFTINSAAMQDKIVFPFYVAAHELIHEWFGNRVMPADAEGAVMLTESLTEYLSLCVYREHYGDTAANRFLKLQESRYYNGRKKDDKAETPLYRVRARQEYISYGKGALVFEKIARLVGRDRFDGILKMYLDRFTYRTNNYPVSADFLVLLREQLSAREYAAAEIWLTQIGDPPDLHEQ